MSDYDLRFNMRLLTGESAVFEKIIKYDNIFP